MLEDIFIAFRRINHIFINDLAIILKSIHKIVTGLRGIMLEKSLVIS
jgi:hypothetical protein